MVSLPSVENDGFEDDWQNAIVMPDLIGHLLYRNSEIRQKPHFVSVFALWVLACAKISKSPLCSLRSLGELVELTS